MPTQHQPNHQDQSQINRPLSQRSLAAFRRLVRTAAGNRSNSVSRNPAARITDQGGSTRRFVNDQSGHVLEKSTQYVGSTLEIINGLSAADALTYLNQTDWAGYLPGTLNQSTISREDDPGVNSHLAFADVSQTPVTHVLVANGEVMAETGGAYQVANFNAAYRQIDASYPSATPGSYTVQAGDNLSSIARAVWGDSSLW